MPDLTDTLPEHYLYLDSGELETVIEVLIDRELDELAESIGRRAT